MGDEPFAYYRLRTRDPVAVRQRAPYFYHQSRSNDVAHALARAASPLLATLGFDSVFVPGEVSRRVSTRHARVRALHRSSGLVRNAG